MTAYTITTRAFATNRLVALVTPITTVDHMMVWGAPALLAKAGSKLLHQLTQLLQQLLFGIERRRSWRHR